MGDLLDMFDEFETKPPTAPKHLKPPPTPQPITNDGNPSFEEIAQSSEFKRFLYFVQFGRTHRGTQQDLDKQLIIRKEEIKIVQDMRKSDVYGGVMKEFKDKVSKIRGENK